MTRMTEAELAARGLRVAEGIGRRETRPAAGIGSINLAKSVRANDPAGKAKAKHPTLSKSEKVGAHKYHAVATDGPDGSGGTRRYPSKKGARLAQRLEAERLAGGIVAWAPEIGIPVGTLGTKAVRHLVDALVIIEVRPDGSFVGRFFEAKGFRVRSGERKRRALEERLGVKVEVY